MQPGSSGQRRRQHRAEALSMDGDPPQPAHQTAEDALFFVVIAVADPHAPRVAPDLGRQKQKPQASCRQCGVLESIHLSVFLTIK